jgi:hypothetical protein
MPHRHGPACHGGKNRWSPGLRKARTVPGSPRGSPTAAHRVRGSRPGNPNRDRRPDPACADLARSRRGSRQARLRECARLPGTVRWARPVRESRHGDPMRGHLVHGSCPAGLRWAPIVRARPRRARSDRWVRGNPREGLPARLAHEGSVWRRRVREGRVRGRRVREGRVRGRRARESSAPAPPVPQHEDRAGPDRDLRTVSPADMEPRSRDRYSAEQ